MTARRSFIAPALASMLALPATAAAFPSLPDVPVPKAPKLQLGKVAFTPLASGTLITPTKVAGAAALRVAGGDNGVRIDLTGVVGDFSKVVTHVGLGIRHVDDGTHAFRVKFGAMGEVGILCNMVKPAGAAMPGSATFSPRFEGAKTFSFRVMKGGKVIYEENAHSGPFTVADFDTDDDGHVETVGVELAYGAIRGDAWSVVVEHGEFTVTMTPHTSHSLATGPLALELRTEGLKNVTLVRKKLRTKKM